MGHFDETGTEDLGRRLKNRNKPIGEYKPLEVTERDRPLNEDDLLPESECAYLLFEAEIGAGTKPYRAFDMYIIYINV